jgi:hypothetical protein
MIRNIGLKFKRTVSNKEAEKEIDAYGHPEKDER